MTQMSSQRAFLLAAIVFAHLPSIASPAEASAQELPPPSTLEGAAAMVRRLTLDEAKERALAASKLLHLASLNAESKAYAIKVARSDYFPKVIGSVLYLHFNDQLGQVLTTQGKSLGPLLIFPPTTIEASVFQQNSTFTTINALQPITDLLKVRQGVKIAQADEQIAKADLERGTRELVSGVEQLYWGLLAARRIQKGAVEGVRGAELLAQTGTLEARTALVEARQALQQVDKQIADIQEQLNGLLDLPLCTTLELVEPPLPIPPFRCVDEVIGLALTASPELRKAQQTIAKAQAAVCAGKLDYVPSIAAFGGYLNQTSMSYVQPNISYLGVMGTYTFIDWGKRRNTIRERQTLASAATLQLQQTEDEVRQKAQKAFREVAEAQQARNSAQEMLDLRTEAEKKAGAPAAMMAAVKARMLAEVDFIKADLAYRQAYVQLMNLVGQQ
ncbi:MAG TPA: TolC family protein [Gemmataceae bacterium]|nr:TolC family protein [Gemmataceae bacterium]